MPALYGKNGNCANNNDRPRADPFFARAHILEGKCWTTPILANGRIYARSTKEAVCLEVK